MNKKPLLTIIDILKNIVDFDNVEFLNKGYSDDKKYVFYHKGTPKYLLRISDISKTDRVREEYILLHRHLKNGVMCQKPITFNELPELSLCYMLLTYIDGESGEVALPKYSEEVQYILGIECGKQLRKIHEIAPHKDMMWHIKRIGKYFKKKEHLKELGLSFYRQEYLEEYIESKLEVLKDSPVRFQHDDFHPSNLIFHEGEFKGVIDFGRFDWGDPYEEFFKLPKYTCDIIKYFAKGQILGYFDMEVPREFWERYNLFVALNQHASLIGGHLFDRVDEVQRKIESIIDSHEFEVGGVPKWFSECEVGGILEKSRKCIGI